MAKGILMLQSCIRHAMPALRIRIITRMCAWWKPLPRSTRWTREGTSHIGSPVETLESGVEERARASEARVKTPKHRLFVISHRTVTAKRPRHFDNVSLAVVAGDRLTLGPNPQRTRDVVDRAESGSRGYREKRSSEIHCWS